MKVTVKELKGKECDIEVESEWSVREFKTVVADRIGTSPECQRLILRGKVLQDEDSLGRSGVTENSRIIATEKKPSITLKPATSNASKAGVSNNNDFWQQLHTLLKRHFTEPDAAQVLDQCRKEFMKMTSTLSLDDIERLAGALLEQR